MSAKRLLMTQLWYQCNPELERNQAILQKKEQLIDIMKGESEALHVNNDQLRYELLCSSCRAYLDRKQPGDTFEGMACPHCIGISGYVKNWNLGQVPVSLL